MSLMANCPTRRSRSSLGMRLSAGSMGSELASEGLGLGERVGVPWVGYTCGVCPYCKGGQENLCDRPLFTGYTRDGGFATAIIAAAQFVFPLGEQGTDASLAPLMCAGL